MTEMSLLAAMSVFSGAPLAIWLHRWDRVNPMRLLAVSSAIGIPFGAIVGIVLIRSGLYSVGSVLVVILSVSSAMWVLVFWKRRVPSFAVDRSSLWFLLLVPVVLYLRLHPVYFIYEIGDMGEYINRANAVNIDGDLTGGFPHFFTAALAISGAVVGPDDIVMLLPLVGLAYWAMSSLLVDLIAGRLVAWILSIVLAVHLVPVWFARFPVSEAVYALLLITLLYFMKLGLDSQDRRLAIAAGILPGALLLLRGNAVLLAPILLLVVSMTALSASKETFRTARTMWIVTTLSLSGAYFYNVTWLPTYFFETQISGIAASAADVMRQLGLATLSIQGVLATLAAIWASVWLIDRLHSSNLFSSMRRQSSWFPLAVGLFVFAGVAFLITSPNAAGLLDAGGRFGAFLVLTGMVGVFLLGGWSDTDGSRFVTLTCAILVLVYSVLYAVRLPSPRGHAFFLYWDRYLFSEVFPCLIVLSAMGLSRVAGWLALPSRRASVLASAGIIFGAAILLGPAPAIAMRDRLMFQDSYQEVAALELLASSEGEAPIFFSGYVELPEGWIFPNSYRAIALPLVESFTRTVPNIRGLDDFGPDPGVDENDVERYLERSGRDTAYLIRAVGPGSHLVVDSPSVAHRPLGSVKMPIEVIRHTPGIVTPDIEAVIMEFEVGLLTIEKDSR